MPPVAETFKEAVERLLAGRSLRDLARQLAEMDPEKQTAESWRRSLNRYDKKYPDDDSAKLIAQALNVPRTQLPRQPTPLEMFQQIDDRLQSVEARLDDLHAQRSASGESIVTLLKAIRRDIRQLDPSTPVAKEATE